jgi:hypothetical protein
MIGGLPDIVEQLDEVRQVPELGHIEIGALSGTVIDKGSSQKYDSSSGF